MKLELTDEQILKITKKLSNEYNIFDSEQGIDLQPRGVPLHITESVLYNSYVKSGVDGGNCWNDNSFYFDNGKDNRKEFIAIKLVLEELRIHHSIIEQTYRDIEKLLIDDSGNYTDYQYYGNYDEYVVEFIPISKLLNYLQGFRLENNTISFNKNKIENVLTDLTILKQSCVDILKIYNIETDVDFIDLKILSDIKNRIHIFILGDNSKVESDNIIDIVDEQGFVKVYDTSEQETHIIPIRFFSMSVDEIKKELKLL